MKLFKFLKNINYIGYLIKHILFLGSMGVRHKNFLIFILAFLKKLSIFHSVFNVEVEPCFHFYSFQCLYLIYKIDDTMSV